jgi:MFS family permease
LFLDGLDVSMVGVALPSIGHELHLSAESLQWIVSGYVLGYGGMLLLGGRCADLLGRRNVFLCAVAVFGTASVVSAFLSNDIALISLRFVKGAAAAFTVPAGLSIVTTTFQEGPARNKAFSIWTICGATGFSSGLVVGGLLTELGWRATFLVPGPVALLLVVVGWKVVPRSVQQRTSLAHFDLVGAATSTAALLLLVFGLVEAPAKGWTSPLVVGLLVASVLFAATFVIIEQHHPQPLLRLRILRSTRLVHANISGAIMAGSYFAFQFVTTLYLQDTLQWSPLAMALGFLPTGLIVGVSAIWLEDVLDHINSVLMILLGLASMTAGYALFLRAERGQSYWNFLLPTMVLLGLGFALCFPAVTAQATAGVVDDEQGLASGLVNTSIQIGGAIVLAVVSGIIGTTPATGAALHGMHKAILVVVEISSVGVLIAAASLLLHRRSRDGHTDETEPALRAEAITCP